MAPRKAAVVKAPTKQANRLNVTAIKQRAAAAFSESQFDQALTAYLDAHAADPSPSLLERAARSQLELGAYAECLALCDVAFESTAISEDPQLLQSIRQLEYISLTQMRKFFRAELSVDRLLASGPPSSGLFFIEQLKEQKLVLRKFATTIETDPQIAFKRVALPPEHRPSHKRLIPYVSIRQRDLPNLLVPRFESPDEQLAGRTDSTEPFNVLYAPRGDPRAIARMFIDLDKADEAEKRRLLGQPEDAETLRNIHIQVIDNNPVSVARTLVFCWLLAELGTFDRAVRDRHLPSSSNDPGTDDGLNTRMLSQLLFHLSFNPVVHPFIASQLSNFAKGFAEHIERAPPGVMLEVQHPGGLHFLIPAKHTEVLCAVLRSWSADIPVKNAKMYRAARRAAKLQAKAAKEVAEAKRKAEGGDGRAEVMRGSEADHARWPELAYLSDSANLMDGGEDAPAPVVEAYKRLHGDGGYSLPDAAEAPALLEVVRRYFEDTWKPNPLFWDPARGTHDLNLRYGDPVRAVHAELAGLTPEPEGSDRLRAFQWHQVFLRMTLNAIQSLNERMSEHATITFSCDPLSHPHHQYDMATAYFSDSSQSLTAKRARLAFEAGDPSDNKFGRTYDRVVLGDTLDYSDGAIGALIALQRMPLAPHATISFDERVYANASDAATSKLSPAEFPQWASTCVREGHMEPVWGVKRVHVAGERPSQHHYVWRPLLQPDDRIRQEDFSHILYTVFLRIGCGPHWPNSVIPTEATVEDLTLNSFFKFAFALAKRGYPGHWLSKVFEEMIKDRFTTDSSETPKQGAKAPKPLLTTAIPLPRRPMAYKKHDRESGLWTNPFTVELETLGSLWAPVMPFPIVSPALLEHDQIGRWRVIFDPLAPTTDKAGKKAASKNKTKERLDYPNLSLGFFASYESRLEIVDILDSLVGDKPPASSLWLLSCFEFDGENTVTFLMGKARMAQLQKQRALVGLGPDFKRRTYIRGAIACGDIDGPRANDPPLPETAGPFKPSKDGDESEDSTLESDPDDKPKPAPAPKKSSSSAPKRTAPTKSKTNSVQIEEDDDDDDDMPGLVPIADAAKSKSTPKTGASKASPPSAKSAPGDDDAMPDLVPVDDRSSDGDVQSDPEDEDDDEYEDVDEDEEEEEDEDEDGDAASDGSDESMPGLMEV